MDPEFFDGFNSWIVYEFRANKGRVGRPFDSDDLVILTTRSAGSRRPRSVPVVSYPDGNGLIVAARERPGRGYPLWYLDLIIDPQVTVETGRRSYSAVAELLSGSIRTEWLVRLNLAAQADMSAALVRLGNPAD
ncbi:hypothetical protein AMIS_50340 [Actinoplanes missouriensis 431]|uniref:Uncharacterized protein n=1 Tax=Actinoplanes missouriensis (strain ATCC 14538 / DSM 43046 / CBS 188.64 / JCM 3121 / NBRC 102363 / NCIMB 12654 / NRRL B-3342 / UNCC 431) TaxID=512565 RepID=I0HB67_ACTM4|nr:nitroreductase/quinone reductase family protein [Actinoplanes missouriensis]BAL90254.1 hypothetical protein AMIS_50340 [Actinoplanes missouriensis 431]